MKKLSASGKEKNTDKSLKFSKIVNEIRNESINKENEKKKSSTESNTSDDSSQNLFKDRRRSPGTSANDRSFAEIKDNFKEPKERKKSSPQLRQQTLTDFSITKNNLSDSTFCEEIEGKKKPSSSIKWLKKSKTAAINNSKQLRQESINKSFSSLTDKRKSDQNDTNVELFNFQFPKPKTPPNEPLPPMTDTDMTPDLTCISPRKKIKMERFSVDLFGDDEIDENSRDESSVVLIEDLSDEPITIVDTEEFNREDIASLQRRIKNITEFDSIISDANKPDTEIPLVKSGVRYKDCQDCHKFYKEKETKNEVITAIRPCTTHCVGYIGRVAESKLVRKTKTMPPPIITDDENSPSGFWDLSFPKSNHL